MDTEFPDENVNESSFGQVEELLEVDDEVRDDKVKQTKPNIC